MSTREELLEWGERERKPIDLGGGKTVLIEQLDQDALDIINAAEDKLKNATGLVLSAINADGTRIFSDGDAALIAKRFSVGKLIEIGNIIMEFNGLGQKANAATAKN